MTKITHFIVLILGLALVSCSNDDDTVSILPEPPRIGTIGEIDTPGGRGYSYTIFENTPENKKVYAFSVTERTGYLFKSNADVTLVLKDSDGNVLASGTRVISSDSPFDDTPAGKPLTEGTMYLEVINRTSGTIDGDISMTFRNPGDRDVDLGVVDIALFEKSMYLNIDCEPDSKTDVFFELKHFATSFTISTYSRVNLALYNEDDENILDSGNTSTLLGGSLAPGRYKLSALNLSWFEKIQGILDISLRSDTDIELGPLSLPYREFFDFKIDKTEPDHKIVYAFSVTNSGSYLIKADNDVHITLKNEEGANMASGIGRVNDIPFDSNEPLGEYLLPGKYYLELMNTSSEGIQGNFTLTIRDNHFTNKDLGVIEAPSDTEHSFEIIDGEPDNDQGLSFEVKTNTPFTISTNTQNIHLALYNAKGENIADSGDLSEISGSLTPGKYFLYVLSTEDYIDVTGTIRIEFSNR